MSEPHAPEAPASPEGARVLHCVFEAWTLLGDRTLALDAVLRRLVALIPQGMTHPAACRVQITWDNFVVASEGFRPTAGGHTAPLRIHERVSGAIVVTCDPPAPPLRAEEARMIDTIADRLGTFITLRQSLRPDPNAPGARTPDPWRALLDMLRRGDLELFFRLSHKMVVHLCLAGVAEAESLLVQRRGTRLPFTGPGVDERSQAQKRATETVAFGDRVFLLAERALQGDEIFRCLQRWIHEERCHRFVRTIVNPDSSLAAIAEGLSEMQHCAREGVALSGYLQKAARVHLIQRFLSTQLDYLRIARNHFVGEDFDELLPRLIQPPGSQGQLGAKAAALLLAARIINDAARAEPALRAIRTPRTWYLTTDSLFMYLCHNDLEDLMEQKYKTLEQVRREYPLILELLRFSRCPPPLQRGLGAALDDLGDAPLIVRSSSLLEDPLGVKFQGKYPSRLLANAGPAGARLEALCGAVAAVYASVFSPDPIEHRAAEGFIDFEEDMGALLQPLVGVAAGPYFLPLFSGSARRRGTELHLRLTAGLSVNDPRDGVDVRLASHDDAPAFTRQATCDHFAALALDTGEIESVPAARLLASSTAPLHLPGLLWHSLTPEGRTVDFTPLFTQTDFPAVIRAALTALDTAFDAPMEIEFASDGRDLYLLHCRRLPAPL